MKILPILRFSASATRFLEAISPRQPTQPKPGQRPMWPQTLLIQLHHLISYSRMWQDKLAFIAFYQLDARNQNSEMSSLKNLCTNFLDAIAAFTRTHVNWSFFFICCVITTPAIISPALCFVKKEILPFLERCSLKPSGLWKKCYFCEELILIKLHPRWYCIKLLLTKSSLQNVFATISRQAIFVYTSN